MRATLPSSNWISALPSSRRRQLHALKQRRIHHCLIGQHLVLLARAAPAHRRSSAGPPGRLPRARCGLRTDPVPATAGTRHAATRANIASPTNISKAFFRRIHGAPPFPCHTAPRQRCGTHDWTPKGPEKSPEITCILCCSVLQQALARFLTRSRTSSSCASLLKNPTNCADLLGPAVCPLPPSGTPSPHPAPAGRAAAESPAAPPR